MVFSAPCARPEERETHASRYALTVRVRLETEAAQVVPIGAKQYVQPARATIEVRARFLINQKLWASAQGDNRVVKVEQVAAEAAVASRDDEATHTLRAALDRVVSSWKKFDGDVYQSHRPARTQAWPLSLGLGLEEDSPAYLTAWLEEAVQTVPLANVPASERAWSRAQAELEALERKFAQEPSQTATFRGEPANIFLATASLSSRRPVAALAPALREQGVREELSFHAEEHDVVSAEDGRLLRATRSASRETRWILPVKSEGRLPSFRARLSSTVAIEELE